MKDFIVNLFNELCKGNGSVVNDSNINVLNKNFQSLFQRKGYMVTTVTVTEMLDRVSQSQSTNVLPIKQWFATDKA